MPTYQYRCTECGHDLEAVQKFTDAPLTECATCGGPLRKIFNAVGVVFKGSGFYRTDSRAGSKEGSGTSGIESGGSESGSSGGSEAGEKSEKKAGEKSGAAAKSESGTASGSGSGSGTSESSKGANSKGAKQPAGAGSSSTGSGS